MAEIEIKVKIDGVEYTQEQLKDLASGAQKAGNEVENLGKKTKETGKETTIFSQLGDKFKAMTGGVKAVIASFKTLRGAIAATGIGALVLAIGSLISYFKNSEEGSRKLAIATEALSIIFGKLMDFASSLGEMIVGVFENPKQAMNDFIKIFKENIVNRFEGLLELIPQLGKALGLLFEGEFSQAGKVAADAVGKVALGVENITDKIEEMAASAVNAFNQMVDEVNSAVDAATKLVDLTRAVRNQQQYLIVENAKLNKELETQQKIAEDTTRSYDERKAALEAVGEAQIKLAENLAKQAKSEEALIRMQIKNESNYEKREELETQLAEAVAGRIDAETALELKKLEVSKITAELDQEELDRKKSINDVINALEEENLTNQYEKNKLALKNAEETALAELTVLKATDDEKKKVIEEYAKLNQKADEDELLRKQDLANKINALTYGAFENTKAAKELELQIAEEAMMRELELVGATEAQKQQVREAYAQLRLETSKTAAEADLTTTASTLSSIGDAFEEGTGAFKAFKITETILSTYSSAQKAFESAVAVPVIGPALGPIAAAAAVAQGLATVKKIASTDIPKAAYGGLITGPAHSAGGSLINAEGGEFIINKYAMRQPGVASMAESLNNVATPSSQGGSGIPIKTYVVAEEVTTAQEATQKIKNLAKL